MPQLLRTNEVKVKRRKHYHVLYLNEETGVGYCTESTKHTHEVQFVPPMQDPQNGQVIQEASWLIMPAEDGHTHEIQEYIPDEQEKDKRDESEIANEVFELFKQALEDEGDSRKAAREAMDFYKGKQWDDENKRILEGQDRACLTMNEIQPNIDTLIGYHIENRQRIDYAPVEGGDQKTSDMLDILVNDHILKRCNADVEETEIFSNIVKVGKGYFDLYMDFDEDIEGQICLESLDWDQVVYGTHKKKDGSDAEYYIKHKMYSMAKMKQLWPEKAEQIDKDHLDYINGDMAKDEMQHSHDNYGKSPNQIPMVVGSDNIPMIEAYKKQYRILECYRKKFEKVPIIINEQDGLVHDARGWKEADVEAVMTLPGMTKIKRNATRIRKTTTATNLVLEDENPADLPDDTFYTIPAYAYKQGNEYWGKIEAVKDPQKEVNYRYSQTVDITNRMTNYGWFATESMFPEGRKGLKNFKSSVSKPGFVVGVNDMNQTPAQVTGTPFPGELAQLMGMSSDWIRSRMNIQVEDGGANESGSKFMNRQKMKMAGNQFLFDNLSLSKRRVGKLLIGLIKRYFPAERIHRIVNDINNVEPQQMGEQPVPDFTVDDIQGMLDNLDLTKYDVIVTESEDSPTTRIGTFLLMSDLAQNGAPIPPELLIEMSEIPQSLKDRAFESLAAQQKAQMQEGQGMNDAEVEKTLVAQGIVPPAVAERMQIQPGAIAGQIPGEGGDFPRPQGPKRKVISVVPGAMGNKQIVVDEVEVPTEQDMQ